MNPYTAAESLHPCGQQFAIHILGIGQRDDLYRVLAWIQDNDIPHEIHAQRIRFRPHTEQLLVQYHLQFAHLCYAVDQPYPSVF